MEKNIPNYVLPLSMPFIYERIEDRRDAFVAHPHRHEFYEVLWFKEPASEHVVDFQPFPVKKDMIFFLAPGKVHHMDPNDKTGHLLVFTQNFLPQIVLPQEDNFFNLFYSFGNTPFIQPSEEDTHKLNLLFEVMLLEYRNEAYQAAILGTHLRAFLLHAQRIKTQAENLRAGKNSERLIHLLHLIETHYKTERAVAFYAERLFLTPKRVNEIVKAHLGKSVVQLVHQRVLLEAKRELYFGERNIKEIAHALGFEDPAYFSRFFKKQTGIAPEQFKTQMATTQTRP
ncbi:MAG: helix-turn-helix domain-containing protein [Anaerolineales bacterium]|nr:helix-turn-helix domain-containing protein [Anaerolineales bacterium]